MDEIKWKNYSPVFESDALNPAMLTYSPWSDHRLFAYDYTAAVQPACIAELGSFYGCSSFAFLQAVKDRHLHTEFICADTWAGDSFTEHDYQEDIYGEFTRIAETVFPDQRISIKRMTFDEAARQVPDHSIDLLHIDGSHTYEDVRHDFLTWKNKVRKDGVIFFHDISDDLLDGNVLGSHIFWEELKREGGFTFEFPFSFGLGVLFFDEERFQAVRKAVNFEYYQQAANHAAVLCKDMVRRQSFQIRSLKEYTVSLEEQTGRMQKLLSERETGAGKKDRQTAQPEKALQDDRGSLPGKPVISIIMGTYNPEIAHLSRAVQSLTDQSFRNWELFIVDDGSDDNLSSEIRKAAETDERIRFIRESSNTGLAHALNRAIRKARGKYIARMDDDDISLPDRLQEEMDFLDTHPEFDWVGCAADLFDDTGVWGKASRPEKPVCLSFLHSSPFIHPSVMFRKSVLTDAGGYCEEKAAARCEDYELFMRLYASGKRGYNLQKTLFQYREDSLLLRRSLKYCCCEMLIRMRGFRAMHILSWKTVPYVFKPVLAGAVSLFPMTAQRIRLNRNTGDHRLET